MLASTNEVWDPSLLLLLLASCAWAELSLNGRTSNFFTRDPVTLRIWTGLPYVLTSISMTETVPFTTLNSKSEKVWITPSPIW